MQGRLSTLEIETYDVYEPDVTYAGRVPIGSEFFLATNLALISSLLTAGFVYSVDEVRDSLTIVY
jgi:hypothetical protein